MYKDIYPFIPVAQTVKHLPTMRETWVRSLGWEDTLEGNMATHSNILAWGIHGQRSLACYIQGFKDTTERLSTAQPTGG